MKNLFSQAAVGWLGRRALDWGGWLGTMIAAAVGFYSTLGPAQQEAVMSALTGRWQDITLGTLGPLAMIVVSQVMSFRATTKPQIVTDEGVKVDTAKQLPSAKKTLVEEVANVADAKKKAERKPGLLDKLFGR